MSYGGYGGDRGGDRYGGGGGGGGGSWGGGGGGSSSDLGNNLRSINWNQVSLIKFEKDFYQEHPAVTAMSEREANQIRESKSITIVAGDRVPKPVRNFEEASF